MPLGYEIAAVVRSSELTGRKTFKKIGDNLYNQWLA